MNAPRPRAYLLLEAAVGGAMVAVIIGSILTSLSQARTMSVLLGRDQTASNLVVEKLEERRALGFLAAGLPLTLTEATVANVNGSYRRVTQVTACTEVIPAPGVTVSCNDIVVTVTYVSSKGAKLGNSTTRTSSATARVYQ